MPLTIQRIITRTIMEYSGLTLEDAKALWDDSLDLEDDTVRRSLYIHFGAATSRFRSSQNVDYVPIRRQHTAMVTDAYSARGYYRVNIPPFAIIDSVTLNGEDITDYVPDPTDDLIDGLFLPNIGRLVVRGVRGLRAVPIDVDITGEATQPTIIGTKLAVSGEVAEKVRYAKVIGVTFTGDENEYSYYTKDDNGTYDSAGDEVEVVPLGDVPSPDLTKIDNIVIYKAPNGVQSAVGQVGLYYYMTQNANADKPKLSEDYKDDIRVYDHSRGF